MLEKDISNLILEGVSAQNVQILGALWKHTKREKKSDKALLWKQSCWQTFCSVTYLFFMWIGLYTVDK